MVVAPALGVWSVAILWLFDGDLPGGHTLISRETFPSHVACIQAIPRYQEIAVKQFGSRGVAVCVRGEDER